MVIQLIKLLIDWTNFGVSIYRTDEDGEVSVVVYGRYGVKIKKYKNRKVL